MTNTEENHESISALYFQIGLLSARITKLETIIVELYNTDITDDEVDWSEVAQQRRDNEEGWRDR